MTNWHGDQYTHNCEFVDELDGLTFPDWEVTGRFYAALHLVQQTPLDEFGIAPRNHAQRADWTDRCARTKPIAGAYIDLRTLSNHVRYEVPHDQVSDERVAEAMILFTQIQTHLAAE